MTITRDDAKEDTRVCKSCFQEKPISEYYRHPTCVDGILHICKSCKRNYQKQYKMLHRTKKERKPLGACVKCGSLDRYKSGDCKVCARAMAVRYRLENPQKVNQWRKEHIDYQAMWKKENPERIIEYRRRFNLAIPGRIAAYSQNYKAKKRENGGSYTSSQWNSLVEKYGGHCLNYGEIKKLTADHIKPISRGGLNVIENIQPLCKSCNSAKGINEIDYRVLWIGELK